MVCLNGYIAAGSMKVVVKLDSGVVPGRSAWIDHRFAEVVISYQESFIPTVSLVLPVAKKASCGHLVFVAESTDLKA